MEEDLRDSLQERIEKQLGIIEGIQNDGGDASKAIKDLKELYEIELRCSEQMIDWNKDVTRAEIENKKLELEEKKFDHTKKIDRANLVMRMLELGIDLTGIVAPLRFGDEWLENSFDFETKGYLSSSTSRGILQRLTSNVFKK